MASKWQVIADDTKIATHAAQARLEKTDNARHRAMLEMFIQHGRVESEYDVDGTMATLVPEPEYYFWLPTGGSMEIKGYKDVRNFYANLFEGGGIGNSIGNYGPFIVDDENIFFSVNLKRIVPWERAKESGYAVPDESGHYAVGSQVAVILAFDDKSPLMRGETSYTWVDPQAIERVPGGELSDGYKSWLDRFAATAV